VKIEYIYIRGKRRTPGYRARGRHPQEFKRRIQRKRVYQGRAGKSRGLLKREAVEFKILKIVGDGERMKI